ncbi:MAG: hypothetical protein Q9159_001994 [Coniocarpon cinnabarinum]
MRKVPKTDFSLVSRDIQSTFQWSSSGPLVSAKNDGRGIAGIKDPSIVYYNGEYHVFASTAQSAGYSLVYFSFTDFNQANSATFHYLDQTPIGTGYRAAPQVFYFAPQKLWYLVFQNGNAAYSTNPDISNPAGWSAPKNFYSSQPSIITQNIGNGYWVDIWNVCDTANCYLFSSDDNGHLYRSQTTLADFPNGMTNTVITLSDLNKNALYEASNVYNVGGGEYLLIVEAIGSDGRRYFRSWTSRSLSGSWTPLAATESNPFARANNVAFTGTAWTKDISHGEVVRTNERVSRSRIVQLQERVEQLELALAQYDIQDGSEADDEELVRNAAAVEFKATAEHKHLGPSSGTTMTRLVMRMAKHAMAVKSINDVIPAEYIRQVGAKAAQQEARPIAKNAEDYPLISAYAERKLPGKELCDRLIQLYNIKVQSMYPLFHEASLPEFFDEYRRDSASAARSFIVLMIVAISVQRLETKYSGVADSFYLGALTYFEEVVRAMNFETLQSCILIGQYSLLTPTRTAAWYIVGLGVRLAQQLDLTDEETIGLNEYRQPDTPYNIDMKRRAFWAIVTMDYGLAHSLGRPASMATSVEHLNVKFFLRIDDEYIQRDKIHPGPFSIRKWIAMHFYKMRLLQLEIRRVLYLCRRPTPNNDADPWFKTMERKLKDWRHDSPNSDEGSGFGDSWFKGRYHTMIVFLFRPSPQVPKPSARAALLCYDACESNIYMHRDQATYKTVEMTWIWTQSIFMAVNTILWSLSYVEVREKTSRESVETHLRVAMDVMRLASERWPGVDTAIDLYEKLITACLRVFDCERDVSLGPNPYTDSERSGASTSPSPHFPNAPIPLASLTQIPRADRRRDVVKIQGGPQPNGLEVHPTLTQAPVSDPSLNFTYAQPNAYHAQYAQSSVTTARPLQPSNSDGFGYPLPTTYSQLSGYHFTPASAAPMMGSIGTLGSHDLHDEARWTDLSAFGEPMNQMQHDELVQDLQTNEIPHIGTMVQQGDAFWQAHAIDMPYQWEDALE